MTPSRVLVVDDQPSALYLLQRSLAQAWSTCRVDVALSAGQARPLIRAHHYDAVVTDFYLGDGCGLDLARLARDLHPSALVILTSASQEALDDAAGWAVQEEIDLRKKPIDLADLIARIDPDGRAR